MAEKTEDQPDKLVDEPIVEVLEAEKPVVKAEEGISKLKEQLEEEKKRRAEAERRAAEAAQLAHSARSEVEDTNLQLVNGAIDRVKSEETILKQALKAAWQSGDFDRAADIQGELSLNAAKRLQLENGRDAMAEKPKKPAPVADPVEFLARQLTPRSAKWVREHPEYASDPRLYQKMIAAHNLVVTDGVMSDSDEYFEKVEEHLGLKSRRAQAEVADEDPTEMAAKVVARRQSPVAAPVSRSGSAPGTDNPRVVRLTKEQAEIAAMTGLTPEEYWKQLQRVKSDTRYN